MKTIFHNNMATIKLQQALDYAKQNPDSDFSSQLRTMIETGKLDNSASQQGVDISRFPRKESSVETKQTFGQDFKSDIKGIGTGIRESAERRVDTVGEIQNSDVSGARKAFQTFGQGTGLASDVIGEGFVGLLKAFSPESVEDKVGEKVGQVAQDVMSTIQDPTNTSPGAKLIRNYQNLKETNPEKARDIDTVLNTLLLGTDLMGGGVATKGAKGATQASKRVAGEVLDSTGRKIVNAAEGVRNVAGDVIPSAERVVNFQVSRALDLTQGDLKNIVKSTGNEVGEWLADKNLIMDTKDLTEQAVKETGDNAFAEVRNIIKQVNNTYQPVNIPRYKQALKEIQKQVGNTAGLEDVSKEVKKLLAKKTLNLEDAQRVKELMDEQFSLYKVTGDVKESVAKEGLAKMRTEIKEFIEKEAKDSTGSDIAPLNNDVATARSISQAIVDRSTRGLTRSNLSLGDYGAFGVGSALGSPLFGAAALGAKKIVESPSIKLRFSRWLDKVTDAKKARIARELKKGNVPKEVQSIIDEPVK